MIIIDLGNEKLFTKEDSFTLTWIHSVEKEPWYEVYRINNDELVLTDTYFKTFGAGVPADLEVVEDIDGFVHMKPDQEIGETFNLIVSDNVETTLIVDEREILLYEKVEPYTEVVFEYKRIALIEYIGGELLWEKI